MRGWPAAVVMHAVTCAWGATVWIMHGVVPDQDEDELAALTARMKALLGPFVLRCA